MLGTKVGFSVWCLYGKVCYVLGSMPWYHAFRRSNLQVAIPLMFLGYNLGLIHFVLEINLVEELLNWDIPFLFPLPTFLKSYIKSA